MLMIKSAAAHSNCGASVSLFQKVIFNFSLHIGHFKSSSEFIDFVLKHISESHTGQIRSIYLGVDLERLLGLYFVDTMPL